MYNNKKIVKLLLDNGADINATNIYNNTPLHEAIKTKNIDVNIIELLLKNGAKKNIPNKLGSTPFHKALRRENKKKEEKKKKEKIINLFFNVDVNTEPVDIILKDEFGNPPVYTATEFGDIEIVRLLLAERADVNTRNRDGIPLLFIARFYKHKEIVRLLLANGAFDDNT
jgi:ankyrin repeat protein